MSETRIRDAREEDIPQIAAIYRTHVLSGTATFEETPPDEAEMARRLAAVLASGHFWLCAERDEAVVGYAYATQHKARSAYRFTAEDSIYLRPETSGIGIGTRLLGELIARASAIGFREMLAVIGDSTNAGSIGLHRKLGFRHVGTARGIGWKFGQPVDVVYMQKSLSVPARRTEPPHFSTLNKK
ncbi:GNAT family N-acetyltransferase [Nisaea acidiphila]|uniref:GNAT family N-acetyltransferase n=1 Tax=Nisaea acidiphila TaxID=1862145 RepID=A0A9J7AMG0_9PROT|nr:GNAT family N-acetyltransferase [Nisaea acidiphila]UUX48146.1 GNAT family N-acetyltransferase [Nisaea acidiphila]